jgi:GTP cyclohydrolase I
MNDQPKIEHTLHELKLACEIMLKAVGENAQREGLKDTPIRFSKMFSDLTSGYTQDPYGIQFSFPVRDCKRCNISRGLQ